MGKIVIGFDGSDHAVAALEWAAREAIVTGDALEVVRSWHEPVLGRPVGRGPWVEPDEHPHSVVDAIEAEVGALMVAYPDVAYTCRVVGDKAAHHLITTASRADLTVVGARGLGGFLGLDLGSVSSRVARQAAGPVVVVRGAKGRRLQPKVVVGVDGSPCSRHALGWAARWARAHHKELLAVLAWNLLDPPGSGPSTPAQAGHAGQEAADAADVLASVVAEVVEDRPDAGLELDAACDLPAHALLDRTANACLVVVGRNGTSHWAPPGLGATAQQVLHHAPCPVAVIPCADPEP